MTAAPTSPLPFLLRIREAEARDALHEYAFSQGLVRIGRGKDNDVLLVNRHMSVSRRHAEIRQVGGHFLLVDLGSKNATRLNGLWLRPMQAYPLRVGDTFEISDFTLEFVRRTSEA